MHQKLEQMRIKNENRLLIKNMLAIKPSYSRKEFKEHHKKMRKIQKIRNFKRADEMYSTWIIK